ncbi:response regulator [Bacillus benzoevorans]|uniref:Circadian input-output histidine kinase CikA n=1 Tax=Bacillus benzoevorans TaxID=1456 RepID=A0A7X0HR44_9BACI|nr:response regulator [Bacillus benzoevorans]MBB6445354.1 two-component system chemotaxis sensor kinase CheA [Bacillus benzoevorans]
MKFATRLYVGFGLGIMMMTILLLLNISIPTKQNQEMNELVQEHYEIIKRLHVIRVETFFLSSDISGSSKIDIKGKSVDERLTTINESVNILKQFKVNEKEEEQLHRLTRQVEEYAELYKRMALVKSMNSEIDENTVKKINSSRDSIFNLSTELINEQEIIMDQTMKNTEERLHFVIKVGAASIISGIVIGMLLSIWSIRAITVRLGRVKNVMNSVENGSEQLPRIKIIKKDEIGEIAIAYNQMAAALETHEKKERLYKESIETKNWLKTQLAELSALAQDVLDISGLGERYIQSLVPIVAASYGVIYIKREGDRPYVEKLASYGDYMGKQRVEYGEGLVGQCLLDGKPIRLHDIPKNYIKISSGLGEAEPRSIMILPIQLNGEVLAVLEIASIYEFTEFHDELLQKATEQLGIILNRIQKQMQVHQLLEETQTLNDELQSQSEELQLQQEELRTINEELEGQYKQSEQRSEDLQKAKFALEEKTQQLLLSSQYKSEFLANMSHELRTPLNSLLILAQILEENKEGNLTEKQIQYANTIHSSGKDLLGIINEILDISKIESGKVDPQISEIDTRGIISLINNQFSAMAEQKGIHFEVSIDEDVPCIIYSDEQKIYQILKNLVANALKFTVEGSVRVKVYRSISKSHPQRTESLAFCVSDTGIGIPKEKQELIFEAFQQADGTTSRKYGGTGLGLSISKGLAALLGGSITVNSNENKGSEFTFILPALVELNATHTIERKEAAAAIESKGIYQMNDEELQHGGDDHSVLEEELIAVRENFLAGKHILLVDDDMRNVFALTTTLESVGIHVHFAENGREALEVLNEKPMIDLVLMDIMMPEMDGYDAMKKIREQPALEKLPIIALTAKAMKDDREKCINAGASDYISKPVNIEQLLSLLKVWLYQ